MDDLPAVIKRAFIDAGAIYDTTAPTAAILAASAAAVAGERERCAQLAEQSMAVYLKPGPVRYQGQQHTHDWQPFADLLRKDTTDAA